MTTKELLALVGRASELPWADVADGEVAISAGPSGDWAGVYGRNTAANAALIAALIAAAVNALPALCAEVEAVREMMRGMIAEADRGTDPFIRARAYLATVAKEPK